MPGRLTIIQGHPDRAENHLCHALSDAYADGALSAGHEVSRIEIARINFPLLRTQQEFERGPLPEALVRARDALGQLSLSWSCSHYGTAQCWLSSKPLSNR
jgi:putative NADPH-quinone reductase